MTELMAEDVVLRAMIVVNYTEEPSLGLLVPAEMRERYDIRGNALRGGSADLPADSKGGHLRAEREYQGFRVVEERAGR